MSSHRKLNIHTISTLNLNGRKDIPPELIDYVATRQNDSNKIVVDVHIKPDYFALWTPPEQAIIKCQFRETCSYGFRRKAEMPLADFVKSKHILSTQMDVDEDVDVRKIRLNISIRNGNRNVALGYLRGPRTSNRPGELDRSKHQAGYIQQELGDDARRRRSLLHMKFDDKSPMLWYVEMQPDVEDAPLPMPMIVINPRFTRKPEADQRFIGLVLPEAIRRIIMEMAIHDDHFGREKWFERWDTYLKTLCPGGIDGIRGDYNGTQEDDIRCLDERIRRIVPIILKGKHLLALTD